VRSGSEPYHERLKLALVLSRRRPFISSGHCIDNGHLLFGRKVIKGLATLLTQFIYICRKLAALLALD